MFWLFAGLLLGAALLFVLPALLQVAGSSGRSNRDAANIGMYREELAELERERLAGRIAAARYDEAKAEIQRRLLEDVSDTDASAPGAAAGRPSWRVAGAVGVLVPVVALAGYATLGNLDAIQPKPAAVEVPHAVGPAQIAAMAARLAERLKQAPEDAEGWAMLARSLNTLGRYDEAARAYAHLSAIVRDNADVLADYADTLAMARGRRLAGEPHEIVARALRINPNHVKSLALAGSAEFERANFSVAASYWERALALAPPDSGFARSLHASLDQARAKSAPGLVSTVR